MSDIVISWLDKVAKFSRRITSIEDNFANGYLFGEWLDYQNQIDNFEFYRDSNDSETVTNNFQFLSDAFKALDFDFSENTKHDIINKKKHAASLFIYKLKKFFDRKAIHFDQIKFQNKKDSQFTPFSLFTDEEEKKKSGIQNESQESINNFEKDDEKKVTFKGLKYYKYRTEGDIENIIESKNSSNYENEFLFSESIQAQRETMVKETTKETMSKEEKPKNLSISVGNLREYQKKHHQDTINFILNNNKKENKSLKSINELKFIEVNQQFDIDVFIEHMTNLGIQLNEFEIKMLRNKGKANTQLFSSQWVMNKLRDKMNERMILKKQKENMNKNMIKHHLGITSKSTSINAHISKSVAFNDQFNLRLQYERNRDLEEKYNRRTIEKAKQIKSLVVFNKNNTQTNNRYSYQNEEPKFGKEIFFTSLTRQNSTRQEQLIVRKIHQRKQDTPYISTIIDQILEIVNESYKYQQENKVDLIDLIEWRKWSLLFIKGQPLRLFFEDEESKEIKSTQIEKDDIKLGFTQYDENEYLNYAHYLGHWKHLPIPENIKGAKLELEEIFGELIKAKGISIESFEPTEDELNSVTIPKLNCRNYLLGDLIDTLVTNKTQQAIGNKTENALDKDQDKENKDNQFSRYNHLSIKLCLTGYPCSGKKSLAKMIKDEYPNIKVYNIGDILQSKVNEYNRIHSPIENHPKYKTMKKPQIEQLILERENEIEEFKEMSELLLPYTQGLKSDPLSHPSNDILYTLFIEQLEKDFPSKLLTEVVDEVIAFNKKKTELLEQLNKLQNENVNAKKPKVKEEEILKKEINKIVMESYKGFVLTDYPNTVKQFAQLEKYFSGYIPEIEKPKTEKSVIIEEFSSIIDVTLRQPNNNQLNLGGFDFIINISVEQNEILRRYEGLRFDPVTGIYYHLDDNPPSSNDKKIKERLVTPQNLSLDEFNYLVKNYNGSIDEVIKFFMKFGNDKLNIKSYQNLDGNSNQAETYKQFNEVIVPLISKYAEEKNKEYLTEGENFKDISPIQTLVNVNVNLNATGTANEVSMNARTQIKYLTKKSVNNTTHENIVWNLMLHGDTIINQLKEFALNYISKTKTIMRFINRQSNRIVSRIHLIQKKFIQYLSGPSTTKSLINIFITKWTTFMSEHSNYISNHTVKQEYKEDLDMLTHKLWILIQTKKEMSIEELNQIKTSGFIENEITAFYNRIENLFFVEASKYLIFIDIIRRLFLINDKSPSETFAYISEEILTDKIKTKSKALQEGEEGGELSFETKVDLLFKGCFILIVKIDEKIREITQLIKAAQISNEVQHKKKLKKMKSTVSANETNNLEEEMKNLLHFTKEQFKYRAISIKYFALEQYTKMTNAFQSVASRLDEWIVNNVKYQNDSLNELKNLFCNSLSQGEIPSIDNIIFDDYSHLYQKIDPLTCFWNKEDHYINSEKDKEIDEENEKKNQINIAKIKKFYDEVIKYCTTPSLIKIKILSQLLLSKLIGGNGETEKMELENNRICNLSFHHINRLLNIIELPNEDKEKYDSYVNISQLFTLFVMINCTLPTDNDIQNIRENINEKVFNSFYCKKEDFSNITFWFEQDIDKLFKPNSTTTNCNSEDESINIKVKNVLFDINKSDNEDKLNIHQFIEILTLNIFKLDKNNWSNKTYFEALFIEQ